MNAFKIHCMCVVKNEADIIAHTLRTASSWADFIYIYDNGSTDETWDIVRSLESDRIIPWKQDRKPFCESLRGELFQAFRHQANDGDWWCRLDSDEFYVDDPRIFLSRIRKWLHVVWGLSIQYYITEEDLKSLDFSRPVEQLLPELRYYNAPHSEIRFFRYRSRLTWPEGAPWPIHMGPVCKELIPYRHYKYRNPDQVKSRLETRVKAIREGFDTEVHYWNNSEWNLPAADTLNVDDGIGEFVVDKLPQHKDSIMRHLFKIFMSQLGLWP